MVKILLNECFGFARKTSHSDGISKADKQVSKKGGF